MVKIRVLVRLKRLFVFYDGILEALLGQGLVPLATNLQVRKLRRQGFDLLADLLVRIWPRGAACLRYFGQDAG